MVATATASAAPIHNENLTTSKLCVLIPLFPSIFNFKYTLFDSKQHELV